MRNGCAVTIGFFDGVHRGHRFLLRQLEQCAAERGLTATLMTFDRHPRQVLDEDFVPSLLTVQAEKLALLSGAFGGRVAVLPFTRELSTRSARDFMLSVLRGKLDARLLLMGYNHHFGHDGGSFGDYQAWGREAGIEVVRADALPGEKVSSSRIRTLIGSGDVEQGARLLGYPYFLTGRVVGGRQIGRQLGFPTANLLVPEQKLLPGAGVYAVSVSLPGGERRDGMLNIGRRPTTEENGAVSVEAHLFDFEGNLYGQSLTVGFISRLRDERHFPSLGALRRQLTLDAVSAREKSGLPR